jgi:hypothetical protein
MVLYYYILDDQNNLIDKILCSWIITYKHPSTITGLLLFCSNQIEDIKYQISLLENSDITNTKETLINELNKCITMKDLIECFENKTQSLKYQYDYMVRYEIESYLNLLEKIISFQTFLEKYKNYNGSFSK